MITKACAGCCRWQTRRVDPRNARALWHLFEPVHALTYFSPQARQAATDLGLKGYWAGYVTMRAAPLGHVSAAVVTAAFHGFASARVEKVLPAAWDIVTPQAALDSRARAAAAALREVSAAGGITEAHVERAAEVVGAAAAAVDVAGRILGAANAALRVREDPYERLWQATTTLREHRGDGHVAALVSAGISPVESHLLKIAAGETPEESLRLGRAWSPEQWDAGVRSLFTRGWTEGASNGTITLTDTGRAARDDVELRTDVAASGPWAALGAETTAEVTRLLRPVAEAVAASGVVPFPNPVGLGWPPPSF